MAWKFVQENWDELYNRYEGGFLLSRLIKATTEMFVTEQAAKEVEEFFAKHSVPAAVRTVQQSLENIRLNCTWLSRESNKISTWLEEKGYQNVTTDEIFEDLFTARLGCQTTLDETPSEMSKIKP